MARIRTIKPEFWTSEQVMDCKPVTRLLFIGLWNFVDDYGRAPVAPRTIKAQVMPGDEVSGSDIQDMLNELNSRGLILFYSADEKEYFEITGWAKHQKIDNPSKYKVCPAPFSEQSQVLAIPREPSPTIGLEGRGGESKGKEKKLAAAPRTRAVSEKGRKANATPLPDDYALPEKVALFGATQGLSDSEMNREHQRFCNHAKQNDRRCVDWIAAERNWMIGSAEKLGKSPRPEVTTEEMSGFYAKFGSEEQDAWDAYGKQKTGKSFPRDGKGGWRHPAQWPPGYVPVAQTLQQPPTPNLKSM